MADIVLLFVLKGRDCMSKVLIEVLVIILIEGINENHAHTDPSGAYAI